MGIDITDLDVHVKGPDILGIHNTREDLHDGSKHANGSIKGRNIPETNNDNIHETNDKKDLPIDTKKDLQEGEVDQRYICGQQFYPGWF